MDFQLSVPRDRIMPNPNLPALPPVLLPDATGSAYSGPATPDSSVAIAQQGMTGETGSHGSRATGAGCFQAKFEVRVWSQVLHDQLQCSGGP
jgi:hypothetical protein